MNFEVDYFLEMFPIILSGFWTTVSIALLSLLFSILLGFILAAVRYYNIPILKSISVIFTSFLEVRHLLHSCLYSIMDLHRYLIL